MPTDTQGEGVGQSTRLGRKEPWLAVNLSLIFAGLGQIYVGKLLRGGTLLFGQISLAGLGFWLTLSPSGDTILGGGLLVLFLLVAMWNLFDAHQAARALNTIEFERARKETPDPWLAVLFSTIFPGIGHVYTGRWVIGFLLTLCTSALMVASWLAGGFSLSMDGIAYGYRSLVIYHSYKTAPVMREASTTGAALFALAIMCIGLAGEAGISPIRERYVQSSRVESGAMEPALRVGDNVLVSKRGNGYKRRDIVIFRVPHASSTFQKHPFSIKRIAAVGGETVEVRGDGLYIDGDKIAGSAVKDARYVPMGEFGREGAPYLVPKGTVFVMGDNYEHSFDSRYFGAVPLTEIVGRVYKIYWPLSRAGSVG